LRGEVIHQRLDFLYIGGSEKISFESASEKVLRFVQRSSRDFYETPVVLEIVAAGSFSNIRTATVGASHNLLADCVLGKSVPTESDPPDLISQFFSQFVNPQSLEICPAHKLWNY